MDRRPEASPDRVEQLEQALAHARELLAERQRRHEAAERSWAQHYARLHARIAWLETQLAVDVVQRSKQHPRVN